MEGSGSRRGEFLKAFLYRDRACQMQRHNIYTHATHIGTQHIYQHNTLTLESGNKIQACNCLNLLLLILYYYIIQRRDWFYLHQVS